MSAPPGRGCSRRGRRVPLPYNPMSPRGVILPGLIFTLFFNVAAGLFGAQDSPELAARRKRMVETQIAARGVRDPSVLRAMAEAPRHLFVPAGSVDEAYEDYPLPIGQGQTISQP